MASHWHTLARLNLSQWLVILISPVVLFLTWVRLKRFGYVKTLEQVKTVRESGMSPDDQATQAKDTALALAIAIKAGPWWPKCLLRSLTLGNLLSRRGIPFVIRIGVPAGMAAKQAKDKGDFQAHAWVEHAGIVLNDRQDIAADFSAFQSGQDSR